MNKPIDPHTFPKDELLRRREELNEVARTINRYLGDRKRDLADAPKLADELNDVRKVVNAALSRRRSYLTAGLKGR
ncbi:nucleoside triphosphate pyrophosphohydrolase family protein [Lentisalinibacter salinarum]|uniref:hypothetical protein n=1 Tax=Lentisalinibacter salinarum TaxID=2992239 RepID=UPI00386E5FD4